MEAERPESSSKGRIVSGQTQRWLGIGGLVFVALLIVTIFLVPSPPNVHARLAKLSSYYVKGKQANFLARGFVTMAAVGVGTFWFWYFREWLAANALTRRLATVGFAGALIFAASGGLAAGLDFTVSDATGHASANTLQLLNYAEADLVLGMTAAGVVIFLVATALAVTRFRVLPVWLGWVAIVFAVVSFVITPLSLPCIGLWLIATNIVLIVRSRAMEGSGPEPVS